MPMPNLVLPSLLVSVGLPLCVFGIPAAYADVATFAGPMSLASPSNAVFSDTFIANASVTWPLYWASLGSLLIVVPSMTRVWLPSTTELIAYAGFLPFRFWVSAAASVYGLNDDPGGRQPCPA